MASEDICATSPLVQAGLNYSLLVLTNEQHTFTKGYLIFGLVLNAFCLVVWVIESPKYERTRVRPTLFLVTAILCSLAEQACGPLKSLTPYTYPCWIGVIMLALTVPFGGASVLGRHMLYSSLTRFAQAAGRLQVNMSDRESLASQRLDMRSKWTARFETAKGVIAMVMVPSRQAESEEELQYLKYASSREGTITLTLVLSIPVLLTSIIIVLEDPVLMKCTGCPYSAASRNLLIAVFAICFVFGITLWLIARRIKAVDKWGLKNECAMILGCYSLTLCGFLSAILSKTGTEGRLSPYTHDFLLSFGLWLAVVVQSLVQVGLARYEERKLWQFTRRVRNLSSGTLSGTGLKMGDLDEILGDPILADAFEKHLVGELGVESLYFLRQCDQWRATYFDVSPTTRISRARKIFKAYVDTSGLYAVNVSHHIKEMLDAKVSRIGAEDCPREIFDEAIAEIRQMLMLGAVLRFRMGRDRGSTAGMTTLTSGTLASSAV